MYVSNRYDLLNENGVKAKRASFMFGWLKVEFVYQKAVKFVPMEECNV